MSIMPDQPARGGTTSLGRRILFWFLICVLVIMLWQIFSKGAHDERKATSALNYSAFMQQVDQDNVVSATLYVFPSTAEITGELRQPPQRYSVTIPKELISALMDRLRKQGATIQVFETRESTWTNLILELFPFLILFVVLIVLFKARNKLRRSAQPDSANRPLG